MTVTCKVEKKDNGLWYGYYDGRLGADGYITKWGAKRRIKKYHKTMSYNIKEEFFTLTTPSDIEH